MATALADRSEAELKSAAEAFVTRVGQLGSVMTSFWKEVARNLISKGAMSATEFTVSDPYKPSTIHILQTGSILFWAEPLEIGRRGNRVDNWIL